MKVNRVAKGLAGETSERRSKPSSNSRIPLAGGSGTRVVAFQFQSELPKLFGSSGRKWNVATWDARMTVSTGIISG
jgi:hypothetical protein